MNGLTYGALACYVIGFAFGAWGVRGLYTESKRARGLIARIERPHPASNVEDILNMGVMKPLVTLRTTQAVWVILDSATGWKKPAAFVVAAVVIEFAGNVLSLSW